MAQNNNLGANNQNGQNQMNMNMNMMNMNMNMMNMNMNYLNMQNELLKCVMEGMGEQPSDNMATNWNTIMNYVPKFESSNYSHVVGSGPTITLNFSDMMGDKKRIKIGQDTLLKDAFLEYGKLCNISNNNIKKCSFLCNGKQFNMSSPGTIRGNNIEDGASIVVTKLYTIH